MAIAHQIVAVQTTATLISIPEGSKIPYESKVSFSVQNLDSGITVYLGDSTITSSSYGFALLPGQVYTVDLLSGDTLYAVTASGTPNVAVFAAEV